MSNREGLIARFLFGMWIGAAGSQFGFKTLWVTLPVYGIVSILTVIAERLYQSKATP